MIIVCIGCAVLGKTVGRLQKEERKQRGGGGNVRFKSYAFFFLLFFLTANTIVNVYKNGFAYIERVYSFSFACQLPVVNWIGSSNSNSLYYSVRK